MQLPTILTDRKARESFKDKFEVAMAAIVLTSFAIKKLKQHNNPSAQENES